MVPEIVEYVKGVVMVIKEKQFEKCTCKTIWIANRPQRSASRLSTARPLSLTKDH